MARRMGGEAGGGSVLLQAIIVMHTKNLHKKLVSFKLPEQTKSIERAKKICIEADISLKCLRNFQQNLGAKKLRF